MSMDVRSIHPKGMWKILFLLPILLTGCFLLQPKEEKEIGTTNVTSITDMTNVTNETTKTVNETVEKAEAEKEEAEVEAEKIGFREIHIRAFNYGFDPSEIRVNAGERVKLVITNEAGNLHGFAIDEYGIAVQLPPGESVVVEFLATKIGEFEFYSHIYSGTGSASMRGELIVE